MKIDVESTKKIRSADRESKAASKSASTAAAGAAMMTAVAFTAAKTSAAGKSGENASSTSFLGVNDEDQPMNESQKESGARLDSGSFYIVTNGTGLEETKFYSTPN